MNKKLIVILGQTASGKSALAVKLAREFKGEVISADSRQVYRGMDIGTGKVTRGEMQGIPHYLLDVASPKKRFTVTQYRKLALSAINKILKKSKIPILCGGTGFYIKALIDGLVIPEVPPDWKLRRKLEKKSAKELYKLLKKIDQRRAKNVEKENPRRLIRAIEIVMKTKKPVPVLKTSPLPYPILMIGIKKNPEELKGLIKKRLLKRLKLGMVAEVKKLQKDGVSWKRLEEFGLEYRWIARYLQAICLKFHFKQNCLKWNFKQSFEKSDYFNRLQKDTWHYAKRQMTWFGHDNRIRWVGNDKEAEKIVRNFLGK